MGLHTRRAISSPSAFWKQRNESDITINYGCEYRHDRNSIGQARAVQFSFGTTWQPKRNGMFFAGTRWLSKYDLQYLDGPAAAKEARYLGHTIKRVCMLIDPQARPIPQAVAAVASPANRWGLGAIQYGSRQLRRRMLHVRRRPL